MITFRSFRVGGLRFLRLGRWQLSVCYVRPKARCFCCAGQSFTVYL